MTIGFAHGHFTCNFANWSIQVSAFWSANEVHHFALTYDSAQKVSVYLDGVLVGGLGIDPAKSYRKGSAPLYILTWTGSAASTKYHTFIDNIKIWDYPKTDFSDRFTE
jgi:hypothetical protein